MAEIVWTTEALDCLERIHDYIADDNPKAARKVAIGIYDKIQMLSRQPQIGQRYEVITDREVREILYGHYRIAYLIRTESCVEILGIFHGRMDIERYLS
ncbi:MAG: type II toxin-antitoxin system RelE/ParE family toxin [Planctomycetaceae bacterium]